MQTAKNWCDEEIVKKLEIWRWSKQGPSECGRMFLQLSRARTRPDNSVGRPSVAEAARRPSRAGGRWRVADWPVSLQCAPTTRLPRSDSCCCSWLCLQAAATTPQPQPRCRCTWTTRASGGAWLTIKGEPNYHYRFISEKVADLWYNLKW